ncbi:hypothetical protein niasHT_007804 [Heterodera trifolii]|uniref:Uncharacterized protein n=1 Tax=Heterodera trifolii TaxID=157864 RepID=A0ABD2LKV7_9BILA
MHSVRGKQCKSVPGMGPLAVRSSAIPLATLCLLSVLFLDQMLGTTALRCYQTQSTLMQPVQGSPTDCPMMGLSCIKSVDYSQGLVTRACQSNNCTMMSGYSCQNTSSYPPQTFCCCYGDGCNSSLRLSSFGTFPLLLGSVFSATLAFGGAKWLKTFIDM